ncbi:MAG: MFS transporter [Bryobacteraceae bacterium]|nr:MFS transporter [Bryobacteraceae bacterium]MDW8379736.1 MFS transporter [Bryobacterales bacterium]
MSPIDRRRWLYLTLLVASLAINLVDRQVLAVLAPVIREELGLSPVQYSYIVTAFLLGLALAQLPSGMFLDRVGVRWGLPVLIAWWSAANALHGLARNVWHLCGFRFLLGVGECGNYSAGVKVIAQWFPARERALAGGIFNSGTVLGSFLAPYFVVQVSHHYGWRLAFVLVSLLGVVWLAPWLLIYRERSAGEDPPPRIPLRPLLRRRQIWGAVLIRTLAGPVMHFYWYWLPEYLKRERGFTMDMIGLWAGVPFLFAGVGNVGGGWFAAVLMRQGWSADRTRKTIFLTCGALCLISSLVPFASQRMIALALICLATFAMGALTANNIGLLTDLFSPQVIARITGLTGMCEGFHTMLVTLATGAIVQRLGYWPVFLAMGLLPTLAVSALFLLVRRVERVE